MCMDSGCSAVADAATGAGPCPPVPRLHIRLLDLYCGGYTCLGLLYPTCTSGHLACRLPVTPGTKCSVCRSCKHTSCIS